MEGKQKKNYNKNDDLIDRKGFSMKTKKMSWILLAMMTFSTVWGFNNNLNGFIFFDGVRVIPVWVLIFALYFIPYAMMVGEMGSMFRDSGSGVSSWVEHTSTRKLAYYAGWTTWAVHVSYIAMKTTTGLKALSWAVFRNGEMFDTLPALLVQFASLAVFLLFCWVATKGLNPLKTISTLAGTSIFILSVLFILMMFAAPAVNPNGSYLSPQIKITELMPKMNLQFFSSISIIILAVGGCEKLAPYVNNLEKPSKEYPRSMMLLVVMIVSNAILSALALSRMFDPAEINASTESFNSYVANGAFWAFQKVGAYYHIGDSLMILYAIGQAINNFSSLLISIDAPLRVLLGNESTKEFIPSALFKRNKNGVYRNGVRMVMILSGSLILIQAVIPGAAAIILALTKLNSVCMPLRYLWVFAAYYMMRRRSDEFKPDYRFVKSDSLAKGFAVWCFLITLLSCLFGMYDANPVNMLMNIVTPIVLILLGGILPYIAGRERKRMGTGGTEIH